LNTEPHWRHAPSAAVISRLGQLEQWAPDRVSAERFLCISSSWPEAFGLDPA